MDAEILVVSQSLMQSSIMAQFINASFGLPCRCLKFSDGPEKHLPANGGRAVFLLDYCDNGAPAWLKRLDALKRISRHDILTVLINVARIVGVEEFALNEEVRGLFYEDDSPEMIIKGIKAVLAGELWYSRKVLSLHLLGRRTLQHKEESAEEKGYLTKREREILAMVAAGVSNYDIAHTLCISMSTVKSHLYRIYEKIQVPNRTKAALWASENL